MFIPPCKGAGTATLVKIMDIVRARGGHHVFTEPTPDAKAFYEKCAFTEVKGWTPKEDGACCGMAAKATAESIDTLTAKIATYGHELLLPKESGLLGTTRLHFKEIFYRSAKAVLAKAA